MYQGIKGKIQGADHIKVNKPCQDATDFYISEKYAVAVVADGHGGKKYIRSEIGSECAVRASIEMVKEFMADFDAFSAAMKANSGYVIRKMQEQFLSRWTQMCEQHLKENPLTQTEQDFLDSLEFKRKVELYSYYGSTVMIAVIADGFYYGLLVGDGGFVVVKDDLTTYVPIEDPYSLANYVSSICQKDAIDSFQGFYEEGKPLSLTVSSDGLIKSFGTESTFLDYHVMLTAMMDNPENCQVSLMKNIRIRSERGSGDDISVAAIFDPAFITEKKPQIIAEMNRRQQERKKIAAAEKAAAEKRKKEMEERIRRQEEERRQEEARKKREEEAKRKEEERRRREAERRLRQEEARRQAEERRRQNPFARVVVPGQNHNPMSVDSIPVSVKDDDPVQKMLDQQQRELDQQSRELQEKQRILNQQKKQAKDIQIQKQKQQKLEEAQKRQQEELRRQLGEKGISVKEPSRPKSVSDTEPVITVPEQKPKDVTDVDMDRIQRCLEQKADDIRRESDRKDLIGSAREVASDVHGVMKDIASDVHGAVKEAAPKVVGAMKDVQGGMRDTWESMKKPVNPGRPEDTEGADEE